MMQAIELVAVGIVSIQAVVVAIAMIALWANNPVIDEDVQ